MKKLFIPVIILMLLTAVPAGVPFLTAFSVAEALMAVTDCNYTDITVSLPDGADGAVLVAAFYRDSGFEAGLAGVETIGIDRAVDCPIKINFPDDASSYKIFLWDGTGDMVPLCGGIGGDRPDFDPGHGYDGIKLDAAGRLVPSAHENGMISSFESGKTPEPGMEIYVATPEDGGSDATGDGSFEKPYSTLAKAVSAAGDGGYSGKAILIMPGLYKDGFYANSVHASEEKPFWIGGYDPGDPPVFEAMLNIVRGSYVIFHDLEVRNIRGVTATGLHVNDSGFTSPSDTNVIDVYDGKGVKTHITNSHHFVFRGIRADEIDYQQFKFAGVAYVWIYDCEISNDKGGSAGIDCVGCHYFTVAYNYLHDMAGVGIQMKGGSYETDIYGNLFVNGGNPGINFGQATGWEFFRPPLQSGENRDAYEGSAIRAWSNVFVGGSEAFAMWCSTECSFVNNTVINPAIRFFRILSADKEDDFKLGNHSIPHGNTISDNIFFRDGNGGSYYINISQSGTYPGGRDLHTFKIENNLFHNTESPGKLPAYDGTNFAPACSVFADPDFEDASAHGYRLKAGSPAIGGGSGASFPKDDYRGWPYKASRSIGAFEYR